MTTTVRMTVPELCKAVAEEMGGLPKREIPTFDPGSGDSWMTEEEPSADWLATGNGMLEVLEWLTNNPNLEDNTYFVELTTAENWATAFITKLGGVTRFGKGHKHLPTAVLLAFMKAVRGVDVEVEP